MDVTKDHPFGRGTLYFDGGDHLVIGSPASLNFNSDSTFSFYFVGRPTSSPGAVLAKANDFDRQYQFYISNNDWRVIVGGSGASYVSASNPPFPNILAGTSHNQL